MVHGGDIYGLNRPVTDFSANGNPLGLPEGVQNAVKGCMDACARYPDPYCRELVKSLAGFERVRAEQILCGNGAADLIFRLALAVKPQKALLPAPTFSEYEQALHTVGCKISYAELREEKGFRPDKSFLEGIVPGISMVFFCNPNNPTGIAASKEFVLDIAKQCQKIGALLVVDECFQLFLDNPELTSVVPLLDDFRNVLVLKAFTKIFGMPGLRLGYCISSNRTLLDTMRECGQPWAVSVPAQAAGIAAVNEGEYLEETRRLIPEEREFLRNGLKKLGVICYASEANYLFFKVPGDLSLKERLLEEGFLIRSCGNYPGLTGEYYRIAVRTRQENVRLLEAMGKVLKA